MGFWALPLLDFASSFPWQVHKSWDAGAPAAGSCLGAHQFAVHVLSHARLRATVKLFACEGLRNLCDQSQEHGAIAFGEPTDRGSTQLVCQL